MRIWFGGPRIFGIRPGVSFRADELIATKGQPQTPLQAGVGSFFTTLKWIFIFGALWMTAVIIYASNFTD